MRGMRFIRGYSAITTPLACWKFNKIKTLWEGGGLLSDHVNILWIIDETSGRVNDERRITGLISGEPK